MDVVNKYENQLDLELSKIPQLRQLEAATGVKKTHSTVGVAVLVLTFLFFGVAGQFLTNLIGFVYPAYASLKAIESAGKEDDKLWLTYWSVYGAFSIVETFLDILVGWIPFYFLLKSVFFLYLYLPQFQGAKLVYKVVQPYVLENEKKIDEVVDKVKAKVDAVADVLDKAE